MLDLNTRECAPNTRDPLSDTFHKSDVREARERAQDFMAANPNVQRVWTAVSGGHYALDSAGHEVLNLGVK